MIILKLIEKLILLPVWIILALISLCIKLTVNLYGFIKGVFTFLLILLMIGTIARQGSDFAFVILTVIQV